MAKGRYVIRGANTHIEAQECRERARELLGRLVLDSYKDFFFQAAFGRICVRAARSLSAASILYYPALPLILLFRSLSFIFFLLFLFFIFSSVRYVPILPFIPHLFNLALTSSLIPSSSLSMATAGLSLSLPRSHFLSLSLFPPLHPSLLG